MSSQNKNSFINGVFWIILMCAISNLNDVVVKYIGGRLSGNEIAFFRFFFSTIILLPFVIYRRNFVFKTIHLKIHFIRALLLTIAVMLWCYGVTSLPLTLSTTISFTTPFFVLPLSKVFLYEHVGWRRWIATSCGFMGIIISLSPTENFNLAAYALVTSAGIFASLDIINKKLIIKDENMLSMLFYSAFGTTALSFIPACISWKTPTLHELSLLFLLGTGANSILFCLLSAFKEIEISALQPFRYIEFVFSLLLGLFLFNEIPIINNIFGVFIIIFSTLYILIWPSWRPFKTG